MGINRKPSFKELQYVYETFNRLGTKTETAKELDMAETSVRRWLAWYEETIDLEDNFPVHDEPLTAKDCLNELRRVAEIDEEKVVTRDYFRKNAYITDAQWDKHFGTFMEFKRASGVTPTREVGIVQRQIAKHASIDRHRKLNTERRSYAENYIKSSNSKNKTVLICSDLHDKECDLFFLDVFIDTARRLQPDVIVFNGDIFDLPEFSRYTVDPREWDVVGRIKYVHEQIFEPIREVCPDTQIDFIEGNHEFRLLKHLSDATPALKGILSDLHGLTIPNLLGLDRYEINYIAKADMSAYNKTDVKKEYSKNYKIYYDSFICHHFPEGKQLGYPGVNGHHHKVKVDTLYNETFKSYQWVQGGCGHKTDASYCAGEKWSMGFVIAHVDTVSRKTIFEPITVQEDFAVVGGKYYYR